MIRFEEVDEGNWRLGLQVADSQRKFVAAPDRMLARAYAYRKSRSRAYVIWDQDTPVGMILWYDCDALNAFVLSQLFVDERYQGKGYGKAATGMALDRMRLDGKYNKVVLCYMDGNVAAGKLYEGFGFRVTGRDEDEIIMEKML